MLQQIDLSRKMNKKEYKARIDEIWIQAGEIQRQAKELGIPIIVVFEGWDAAGKGTLINNLILPLDPRGFKVLPISAPNQDERLRPFLWRFWINTPARGRIAIFDRSWYGRVLVERIDGLISEKEVSQAFQSIRSFERQLADDGYVIIKFFLHISKKMQKKRFKQLQANKALKWKVTEEEIRHHKQYDKFIPVIEEMIEQTDTSHAPWTIIESHDERFATIKVFETFMNAVRQQISIVKAKSDQNSDAVSNAQNIQLDEMKTSILDTIDLSLSLKTDEYKSLLKKYQARIREIEHEIYIQRIPVVIVYEGWDAAGKGGNIRRLTQNMDPRGYEVIPVGAPSKQELAHHFLWRFWKEIPKAGHITIFDRSWYGRVLVERIEGFCSEAEWKRAYREINEFEQQLTDFGTVLVKFWIHITPEEQLARFTARQQTPHKNWKITDEDWRNREKWDAYKLAVDEMLFRTSTTYAPWTILEGNNKYYARIKGLRTVIEAAEQRLK